eukprot:m.267527 g.267527  ORF g.267527 m.267527 type:complete len:1528 (+) comp15641_c0_seq2:339-4922(+)
MSLEGYFHKQKPKQKGKYDRRYFQVIDGEIRYGVTPSKHKGTIALFSVVEVRGETLPVGILPPKLQALCENGLLIKVPDRTFTLVAEDKSVRDQWMDQLPGLVETCKAQGPLGRRQSVLSTASFASESVSAGRSSMSIPTVHVEDAISIRSDSVSIAPSYSPTSTSTRDTVDSVPDGNGIASPPSARSESVSQSVSHPQEEQVGQHQEGQGANGQELDDEGGVQGQDQQPERRERRPTLSLSRDLAMSSSTDPSPSLQLSKETPGTSTTDEDEGTITNSSQSQLHNGAASTSAEKSASTRSTSVSKKGAEEEISIRIARGRALKVRRSAVQTMQDITQKFQKSLQQQQLALWEVTAEGKLQRPPPSQTVDVWQAKNTQLYAALDNTAVLVLFFESGQFVVDVVPSNITVAQVCDLGSKQWSPAPTVTRAVNSLGQTRCLMLEHDGKQTLLQRNSQIAPMITECMDLGEPPKFVIKPSRTQGLAAKPAEEERRMEMKGFLYKRGVGMLSQQRAWQKRWCVFAEGYLKYYETVIDRNPKGSINVSDMVDVTQIRESVKQARPYSFQIETHSKRNYIMAAESAMDMKHWIDVLQASISKADKVGFLFKKGEQNTAWKSRWFVLRQTQLLYYQRKDAATAKIIDLTSARSVDPIDESEILDDNCFKIECHKREWILRADSAADCADWINAIRNVLPAENEILSGMLKKKGEINKEWRMRYFRLTPLHLTYSDPDSPTKRTQAVHLRTIQDAAAVNPATSCEFHVFTSTKRKYELEASSPEEMEQWVNKINAAVEQLKQSTAATAISTKTSSSTFHDSTSHSASASGTASPRDAAPPFPGSHRKESPSSSEDEATTSDDDSSVSDDEDSTGMDRPASSSSSSQTRGLTGIQKALAERSNGQGKGRAGSSAAKSVFHKEVTRDDTPVELPKPAVDLKEAASASFLDVSQERKPMAASLAGLVEDVKLIDHAADQETTLEERAAAARKERQTASLAQTSSIAANDGVEASVSSSAFDSALEEIMSQTISQPQAAPEPVPAVTVSSPSLLRVLLRGESTSTSDDVTERINLSGCILELRSGSWCLCGDSRFHTTPPVGSNVEDFLLPPNIHAVFCHTTKQWHVAPSSQRVQQNTAGTISTASVKPQRPRKPTMTKQEIEFIQAGGTKFVQHVDAVVKEILTYVCSSAEDTLSRDQHIQLMEELCNDMVTPKIGVMVRKQLCNAINAILTNGFYLTRMAGLIRLTVWDAIKQSVACAPESALQETVQQIISNLDANVQMQNNPHIKARSFICLALNKKFIAQWFMMLNNPAFLPKHYASNSLLRRCPPSFFEEVSLALTPLDMLPFQLHLGFEMARRMTRSGIRTRSATHVLGGTQGQHRTDAASPSSSPSQTSSNTLQVPGVQERRHSEVSTGRRPSMSEFRERVASASGGARRASMSMGARRGSISARMPRESVRIQEEEDGPIFVRALYPNDVPDDDIELRIAQGDILELDSMQQSSPEWCVCTLNGRKGLVPLSYIEVLDEVDAAAYLATRM